MTIIQPKKTPRRALGLYMLAALIFTIILTLINVMLYTNVVNLQHTVKAQQQTTEELRAINGELTNNLYRALDPATLQSLVRERGFIKVLKFHYLSLL